jgi:prepilin-type N-terminal cleavage/methylation domain-containing protein
MIKNKKNKNISGFSLIEIIVSLAIFSFIFSIVIGISISLVRAQTKVQAQVFLIQTVQTTLESMSRSLRYGYFYEGTDAGSYNDKIIVRSKSIIKDSEDCRIYKDENGINRQECTNTTATNTESQILSINKQDSPFIMFEAQGGDPTSYADQNAFCFANNSLYRLTKFQVLSAAQGYEANCSSGNKMLPDNIKLDFVSFDIYSESSENPKNPLVRIKLKISNEQGNSMFMQTTVTQRLVQTL